MFRRPIREINAEFQAEEKHLESIQRVVKEACSSAGMSRKDISAVSLAIEEGATNIIRHAYLYDKGMLRLRIVIYNKLVVFSLIDRGRSFEPNRLGQIDLERLVESGRRGGLGFYMIQKIMDSVEYFSTPSHNELRMAKSLGRASDQTAAPLLRRMFTLRAKFSIWTAIIVATVIGGGLYFIYNRTEREIYAHLDDTVTALGVTMAEQTGLAMINRRSDVEFDQLVVSFCKSNPVLQQVVLVDLTGRIVAHSDDFRKIRKSYQYPSFVDPGVREIPQRTVIEDNEVNYLVLPIIADKRGYGTVHITYTSAPIYDKLQQARGEVLRLTALLALVGIIGIYLLSNYFVSPIVNITRRVRRFTSGDLDSELQLEGADEFLEISSALNQMMTRLRRDRESALERERMTKEIEVASQVQKTLLPAVLPDIPGLKIEAYYRAATTIGGDLYDVIPVSADRYALVVADVSGKGIPASLLMSVLRTAIQIYTRDAISSRATLLSVNEYLVNNIPSGMFITVLMAIYDVTTRRMNLVSAGHNPLLVYRAAERELIKVNPSGMPLGAPMTLDDQEPGESLEEAELSLEEGDLFFLYTDGITEALDREGNPYGMRRLMEFLQRQLTLGESPSLSDLSQKIVTEIDRFSGFVNQRDDITFVLGRTVERQDKSDPDSPEKKQLVDSRTVRDDDHKNTES